MERLASLGIPNWRIILTYPTNLLTEKMVLERKLSIAIEAFNLIRKYDHMFINKILNDAEEAIEEIEKEKSDEM